MKNISDAAQLFLGQEGVQELCKKIDYSFRDSSLLFHSMIHSSYTHQYSDWKILSNERLEFLGDSVLNFIVSTYLYSKYPYQEGTLSQYRAYLVSEKILVGFAKELNIQNLLLLGRGVKVTDSLLSNAFEALIGGIWLDGGEECCCRVIKSFLESTPLPSILSPLNKLQEECMRLYRTLPVFESKEIESGFEVTLIINGKIIRQAFHISKKKAKELLAREVLESKEYLC